MTPLSVYEKALREIRDLVHGGMGFGEPNATIHRIASRALDAARALEGGGEAARPSVHDICIACDLPRSETLPLISGTNFAMCLSCAEMLVNLFQPVTAPAPAPAPATGMAAGEVKSEWLRLTDLGVDFYRRWNPGQRHEPNTQRLFEECARVAGGLPPGPHFSSPPDCLRTLSPEELAKHKPLTDEQITEALERGAHDRDAAEAASRGMLHICDLKGCTGQEAHGATVCAGPCMWKACTARCSEKSAAHPGMCLCVQHNAPELLDKLSTIDRTGCTYPCEVCADEGGVCNRPKEEKQHARAEHLCSKHRVPAPTAAPLCPARDGIYIASRVKHANRWRTARAKGIPIISSWIDEDGEGQTADFGELWERIQREVVGAERLVFFVEPDDFPFKGAYVEVGMALAAGVPVFLVLSPDVVLEERSLRPLGSWAKHPGIRWVPTLHDAFTAILADRSTRGGAK